MSVWRSSIEESNGGQLRRIAVIFLSWGLACGVVVMAGKAAVKKHRILKKAAARRPLATRQRTGTSAPRAIVRGAPQVSSDLRTASAARIFERLSNQPAEFENSGVLAPFFKQLYEQQQHTRAGTLSILQYGDSHTASDDWAGEMRDRFQAQFGNGGAGFSHAGRPWKSYRRFDVHSSATEGWHTEGVVGRTGDGLDGLSGVSIATESIGESVSLRAEGPVLEVQYLQQPGGGPLELSDNGGVVAEISTDGPLGPGYYQRASAPGEHLYSLTTLAALPVRLLGWVTGNQEGVTYETLGINGGQISMMLNWNAELLASALARRNPALIVLAYGTNEASNPNVSLESHRDTLVQSIALLRAGAPAASILLIGPPDRYMKIKKRGWIVYDRVDRIVEAQRAAAKETGCAYLDLRNKMGGKGSMRRWVYAGLAQADYAHLTSAGYRLVADNIFLGLMRQYTRFAKARQEL